MNVFTEIKKAFISVVFLAKSKEKSVSCGGKEFDYFK